MTNMFPVKEIRNTVQHPTHAHPLTEVNGTNGEFICDGCKIQGSGKRYRCDKCDHVMHDYCATCPPTLTSFFMHPHHTLGLFVRIPDATRRRVCDVCNESVEGMFYRCMICDFDVHPLCTMLPQHVRHVLHPAHPLVLSCSGPSRCMVCFGTCESWRYRCGLCGFDVHMECVLAVCDTTKTTQPKHKGVVMQQQPPQHPNYLYWYGAPVGYGPMYPYVYNNNCYNQNMNHVNQPAGPSRRRRMFELVARLTLGVVSNVVFGVSADFLFGL